jgi:hypothetical protein
MGTSDGDLPPELRGPGVLGPGVVELRTTHDSDGTAVIRVDSGGSEEQVLAAARDGLRRFGVWPATERGRA